MALLQERRRLFLLELIGLLNEAYLFSLLSQPGQSPLLQGTGLVSNVDFCLSA